MGGTVREIRITWLAGGAVREKWITWLMGGTVRMIRITWLMGGTMRGNKEIVIKFLEYGEEIVIQFLG